MSSSHVFHGSALRHWLLALVLACNGCALFAKSEPLTIRYYTPELEREPASALQANRLGSHGQADTASSNAKRLRLGRVTGSLYLRERMVFRANRSELGYYEERQWTERPETYLRRALGRVLFEERGMTRVVVGAAPVLEVELVAFDEVLGAAHRARIETIVMLDDERVGRLAKTLVLERPIRALHNAEDDDGAAVAEAMGEALLATADAIATLVDERLPTLAEAPTTLAPASVTP